MLQYVEDQYELQFSDYYIYYNNCYCLYNGEYHYINYFSENEHIPQATITNCKRGDRCTINVSNLDFNVMLHQGLVTYKNKIYYVCKHIGESPYKYKKGACPHNYLIYKNKIVYKYNDIIECPSMVKPIPQITLDSALTLLSKETPNIALSDDVHLNLSNNIIKVYHKVVKVGRYYKAKKKFKVLPHFKLYAKVLNMEIEE